MENSVKGIALVCDLKGFIIEIVRNDIFPAEIDIAGKMLTSIIDGESFSKALDFIKDIRLKNASFDWELNARYYDEIVTLNFAGTLSDDKIFIIASFSSLDTKELLDELMKLNNENINRFRMLTKEQFKYIIKEPAVDGNIYNEMIRLNNELTGAKRELTKKNLQLMDLSEEKNRFLGMAAHDLRNPLYIISAYCELLDMELAGKVGADYIEMIGTIGHTSKFMLDLVNNLLDISQMESGKVVLEIRAFDIVEFINQNIKLNMMLSAKKNISIKFSHGDDIPKIKADPNKITQVINNLLTNAVKFSYPGSGIEVKALRSGENIEISVKDNGPGIPLNEIMKLFKPFSKTSVKSTGGESNSGLGLAIAKRIVEEHKGKIWVESEVNAGSTFFFTLPV